MIFVTVGAQMAFDRLVRTVDEWAGLRGRSDIFAQIGASDYRPRHITATRFLDPAEFRGRVEGARVVVAHAGMGSIITALELGKPIIVMPRRGDLHETRSDHQVATAKHFVRQGRIIVAFDEHELVEKLDQAVTLCGGEPISDRASPRLIAALRFFLEGKSYTAGPVGSDIGVISGTRRSG
jgi:UDP-N-acetylglucosamine transferase subunit ALG13